LKFSGEGRKKGHTKKIVKGKNRRLYSRNFGLFRGVMRRKDCEVKLVEKQLWSLCTSNNLSHTTQGGGGGEKNFGKGKSGQS